MQRYGVETGDLGQITLQFILNLERTLHGGRVLQRVNIGQARQPRHIFVQARIIFHSTRAERIKTHVNRVIEPRQMGKMAHYVQFADFRQAQLFGVAGQFGGQRVWPVRRGPVTSKLAALVG